MPNLNKVMLMGNLTRDPELRHTPSGMAIADFGMAINRQRKGADGNRIDETTFVDITAFGRQAEVKIGRA
ncbi:single-stranded DNA-binding protein, partial [bacterium]|nr:single-stranded DNA-binding protein [bacterium]